jgi:hypothetical protein
MDTIQEAYESGLISPGIIGYEEFEDALRDGKEKCLSKLKVDLEYRSLDNIHGSMSWWACFKQENELPITSVVDSFATIDRTKKKSDKKKAKKKRKKAKASKKKNRR